MIDQRLGRRWRVLEDLIDNPSQLVDALRVIGESRSRLDVPGVAWIAAVAACCRARSWSLPSTNVVSRFRPASATWPTSHAASASATNTI